ncbi:polymorphic toxin-type HINT domain-containing protein [Deinococcus depolymerans]|uniref:Intein C-terminal splicing domain-containing protein n=1 Tax=Deinococcus depolymerans TaxID=392408 RepID=A0ABN1BM87_9DEIO
MIPERLFFVAQPVDAQPRPAPEGHSDLSKNWVGAGHLKIGDTIKQADGTTGLVANVTTVGQTREMFNLTVSEAHTYYVGDDGWLVHNSSSSFANSGNWSTSSFIDSAKAIGADLSNGTLNPKGTKVLFPNASGTKQIVYDLVDGYYRVQDMTHTDFPFNGEKSYLDQFGKPVPENAKVWKPGTNGRPGKWVESGIGNVRKGLTHFIDDGFPCTR